MAETWDVKVDVLNLAEKRVRVTYRRADDGVDPAVVWTWATEGIVDMGDLPGFRLKLTNRAWVEWTAYADAQAAIAAVVLGWESALTADITAKEAE